MILFIQTAFLGDLLLSIPTLKKLKALYPHKPLHVLCRKGLGSVLLEQGLADQVFDRFEKTKPTVAEIKTQLGENHYELLVCSHESIRSNILSYFISADVKIGYKNFWNSLIFDQRIKRHRTWPEVLRQMELLKNLDPRLKKDLEALKNQKAPFTHIPDWSEMTVKNRDSNISGKKTAVLAPGSVWPTKRWGKYEDLVGELLKNNFNVTLIGSPSEKEISTPIKKRFPEVQDLTGETTLSQMMTVLEKADVLICNDSGAMHMASVVQLPTIAIFGPTVLQFGYQAWNKRALFLENRTLTCRPCSSHGTQKCPIGTHECMTSISVQEVLERVMGVIK